MPFMILSFLWFLLMLIFVGGGGGGGGVHIHGNGVGQVTLGQKQFCWTKYICVFYIFLRSVSMFSLFTSIQSEDRGFTVYACSLFFIILRLCRLTDWNVNNWDIADWEKV